MKKWSVGVYLRLSVEDGKDNESNSILNQKTLIDQYVKENKDLKIYDYYIDDGYSGTNFERPDFKRLMQDVEDKKVDSIIVKDLSRFGRNFIETGQYIEITFPLIKLRFISIGDHLDSFKNPESVNNIIVPFKNLMNDDYSRDISNKIKSTLNVKKSKGEFLGAYAPYGYLKNPDNRKELIIDKEASLVIKKIFNDVIKGKSKLEIVEDLNKTNILTPSAYMHKMKPSKRYYTNIWDTRMIDKIIKNKVYIGELIQNKTRRISYKIRKTVKNSESQMIIIKNNHKPIISKNNFELANKILYSRDIRPMKNKEYDIFAGYIKCGDCNNTMANKKYKKYNTIYNYYLCSSYRRKKECSMHKISRKELESIVLDIINIQIKILCDIKKKIDEYQSKEKINFDYELQRHQLLTTESLLVKNKELLKGLEYDLESGYLSKEDYNEYKLHYKSIIIKYEESIKNINDKLNKIKFKSSAYQKVLENLTKNGELVKLTRKLLNEMIDTIYIYENNQIKIKFKYNDEYKNALNFIKGYSAVV